MKLIQQIMGNLADKQNNDNTPAIKTKSTKQTESKTNNANAKPNVSVAKPKVLKEYTMNEIEKHDNADSCWIVVWDKVYDATPFLYKHPGGSNFLV